MIKIKSLFTKLLVQTSRRNAIPTIHQNSCFCTILTNSNNLVMSEKIDDTAVVENKEPEKKLSRKELRKLHAEKNKEKRRQLREIKQANKPKSFTDGDIYHTQYYFENGLRKVKPYIFYWTTTAKERWFGRTLWDIYSNEFTRVIGHLDLNKLISMGQIRVNNEIKSKDYKIKNGDTIRSIQHRHEIPVIGDPIEIIQDDENLLVINKPCSIPVHPCGKYRYNSLMLILLKEYNYRNLRTIYRLDRLTSGVMVFAKNQNMGRLLDKQIKERTTKKEYVCRVVGNFPDGLISVDQPIDVLSFKAGIQWINKNGKEAYTEFKKMSYDGKNSVVLCYPKTGRTHQIRLHLQYLGYPITNDPVYNEKRVWGENNGKDGIYAYDQKKTEEVFLNLHTVDNWVFDNEIDDASAADSEKNATDDTSAVDSESITKDDASEVKNEANDSETDTSNKRKADNGDSNESKKAKMVEETDEKSESIKDQVNFSDEDSIKQAIIDCRDCKSNYKDPTPKDMTMYLHALSYQFGDMKFETKLPVWARDDFKDE